MKIFKISLGMLAVILLIVASCNLNNVEPDKKSGYFILTRLSQGDFENPVAQTTLKAGESDFNLGDLKASREFYFLLLNGGDEPIFDIHLQTGNDAFVITPDHLDMLPGKTTISGEDSPALIPLITLGILHGTQLYGVGYTDLLEMGGHASAIAVSGKTLAGSDTITVGDEFIVEVVARVMDISILDGQEELDLSDWDFAVSSNLGGLGFIRGYKVYHDDIEFSNTGNVPLQVSFGDEWSVPSNNIILGPEETKSITLDDDHVYVRLNSDGTIADGNRIQLGNDGNGYLCLQYVNYIEDSTGFQPDTIK
jgi:hypothetical protein